MNLTQHLESQIEIHTGKPFTLDAQHGIGGGCINAASRYSDGEREFFIKTNQAGKLPMFEAEAEGLREMSASNTVRVPEPVCYGEFGDQSYIVMEYLELRGGADTRLLGSQLADMHRVQSDRFGWRIDNTIGSTPQHNDPADDWIAFWREHRLGYQLERAAGRGGAQLRRLGDRLLADFPVLFESYAPAPSMLHGDLWGGNYGGLKDGTPVIFDPAFYYGDREADLAMTTLFGGFGPEFFSAYNDAWPLDDGYRARRTFYNIYHVLNHFNMFGGGYGGQAVNMIEQVLAEIR